MLAVVLPGLCFVKMSADGWLAPTATQHLQTPLECGLLTCSPLRCCPSLQNMVMNVYGDSPYATTDSAGNMINTERPYGFIMGGNGRALAASLVYIIVIAAWVLGIMTPFFFIIKRIGLMRVAPGEIPAPQCLSMAEHGLLHTWLLNTTGTPSWAEALSSAAPVCRLSLLSTSVLLWLSVCAPGGGQWLHPSHMCPSSHVLPCSPFRALLVPD